MSSKSRHKIGWLSPFLSLLTLGLAKPDANIAIDSVSSSIETAGALAFVAAVPVVAALNESARIEPATIEPAMIEPASTEPAIVEPTLEEKSLDWGKAREFRLSARLSVNAQLNRPKTDTKQMRKIKNVTAPAPRWSRSATSTLRQAHAIHDSAVVIKFPNPGNGGRQLAEAA